MRERHIPLPDAKNNRCIAPARTQQASPRRTDRNSGEARSVHGKQSDRISRARGQRPTNLLSRVRDDTPTRRSRRSGRAVQWAAAVPMAVTASSKRKTRPVRRRIGRKCER